MDQSLFFTPYFTWNRGFLRLNGLALVVSYLRYSRLRFLVAVFRVDSQDS